LNLFGFRDTHIRSVLGKLRRPLALVMTRGLADHHIDVCHPFLSTTGFDVPLASPSTLISTSGSHHPHEADQVQLQDTHFVEFFTSETQAESIRTSNACCH
jgi:hypothetical protein